MTTEFTRSAMRWLRESGVGSRESLVLSTAKDLLPRPQEPAK
jgi:hypothetical protein